MGHVASMGEIKMEVKLYSENLKIYESMRDTKYCVNVNVCAGLIWLTDGYNVSSIITLPAP